MKCILKVINALPQLNTHMNTLIMLKCLNIIIFDNKNPYLTVQWPRKYSKRVFWSQSTLFMLSLSREVLGSALHHPQA